jgi:hypothetical protein
VSSVAMLSLGSFKIGCTLLWGLFLYDIFWVFGTDVMVTVAKSFDAPIKGFCLEPGLLGLLIFIFCFSCVSKGYP